MGDPKPQKRQGEDIVYASRKREGAKAHSYLQIGGNRMEKSWMVYVHRNIENGKQYVGVTSRSNPEIRWQKGRGYAENPHFYAAIQKYGWDGFEHIVLQTNLQEQEAKSMERELIAMWHTQDRKYGYNATSGGDGTPDFHPSEETRKKLSEARKKENLSEETLRRRSAGLRGRAFSEEHKRKIGDGNSKPIEMYDKESNFLRSFPSARMVEDELHISHSHVSQCCHGHRKTAGGYIWKFAQ